MENTTWFRWFQLGKGDLAMDLNALKSVQGSDYEIFEDWLCVDLPTWIKLEGIVEKKELTCINYKSQIVYDVDILTCHDEGLVIIVKTYIGTIIIYNKDRVIYTDLSSEGDAEDLRKVWDSLWIK